MKILNIIFPVFILFLSSFSSDNIENEKNKLILELMKSSLKGYHYESHHFDNNFSEQVFTIYMEKLDYNKRFFLKDDIQKFSEYKYKIDDAVINEDFKFFQLTKDIYIERVKEINKYIEFALKYPFDFSVEEELEIDAEKRTFAEDKNQ
jgi:carboxyl-terminal processing protease